MKETVIAVVLFTSPYNAEGWIGRAPATLRDCPAEMNISIGYNSGIRRGWKKFCAHAEKSFVSSGDRRESPSQGGQKGYGGK